MRGIGGHTRPNRGATDDWLTPPEIIRALGEFDLDPCASKGQPWPTARRHYTWPAHDARLLPWEGRVWCNPPYGPETGRWLDRMVAHGNGVALTFARTETEMFFRSIWGKGADGILFLKGRPHFHFPDGTRAPGNSGGPIVLIAYGAKNLDALDHSKLPGALVLKWIA